MSNSPETNSIDGFGLAIAQELTTASDLDWPVIFERLRREHRLSAAVRQINIALCDPQHKDLALNALRRIGLEHGG